MKLMSSSASPFVRKVRAVIFETGQDADVEQVYVATTPLNSDAQAVVANPLGKLPSLVLDDGRSMVDSRVITRFLNDRGNGTLYPEDRIWDVLTLEAIADGITEAALAGVYERRLWGDDARENWIDAQWAKADRALTHLENDWLDRLSEPFHAGHIALGCALGYLDFRLGHRNWRDGRPGLAKCENDIAKRPSMVATTPSD